MKVVQINSVSGRGSTGKICVAVSKLLTEEGIENYILYSRWTSDYQHAIKFENDSYAKCQAFREKLFGTYGFEAKKPTKQLIKYLDSINPDIVHLHVLHSHDINLTILFDYLRSKHIKLFWTFHDSWAMTGYCFMFDMIGCEKWKTECGHCPERKRYSWFFDRSKTMHDRKKKMIEGVDLTIITPSEWLAGIVKQSFFKNCPVKVIHNGIDLNVFKPTSEKNDRKTDIIHKYSLESKKILLGVADGWNGNKGLNDYNKLAGALDDDCKIVMIGMTDNQINSLNSKILGLPRTSNQEELALWYEIADVVLNLSYEETFGMTTVEGFACGTPCVAYNRTASNEFGDGKTCIVVEAGNIEQIVGAIQTLLTSEDEKRKEICRERAVEQYDNKKVYSNYLKLYSDQMGGGNLSKEITIILGVADVWSERKGFNDFLKLRTLLSENYLIVLVGLDQEKQKQLPKGIIGLSRTQNQQELAQLYSGADLFVIPTYADNYPTTNLEAMACGTPVVTYDTGGSPESITSETGWVLAKGDVEGIATIVKDRKYKSKKMRIECRKRAEEYFSQTLCFMSYVEIYKNKK